MRLNIFTKMQKACFPLFQSFDDSDFLTLSFIAKVLIVTLGVTFAWIALLLVFCLTFYGLGVWFFSEQVTFSDFIREIARGSSISDFTILICPIVTYGFGLSYRAKPLKVGVLPPHVAFFRWIMLYAFFVLFVFILLLLKSEGFHLEYTLLQLFVRAVISVCLSLFLWIIYIYVVRRKYMEGEVKMH